MKIKNLIKAMVMAYKNIKFITLANAIGIGHNIFSTKKKKVSVLTDFLKKF